MKDWVKTAMKLPCGRSVRVKCCNKDLSRVITHSSEGYSTVCFRCGLSGREFVPHGVRTIADQLRHKRELEAYLDTHGDVSLPDDFTGDIPDIGRAWLLKGGVSTFLSTHYHIGWSAKMHRVVIPVYDVQGNLVAVQARAVEKYQKPKYRNKIGVSTSLFWSDSAVSLQEPVGEWCVLTEDILSTLRVGRLQHAVASLGTSISHRTAARILKHHRQIIIWYDGDAAGVKGAAKARKVLELQGAEVIVIRTEEDPKSYNNEQITNIIQEAIHANGRDCNRQ